ncbi:NmrA family NAD(P)-binding protein [Dyadobacter sp. CY261]|uniref:NmrA family NAD(P)-binding protein n=1 Tax=Dyadobacter sp. CY261 TaxID=2907203 RepID=UPI001F46C258|nr:NmrA family NAD(P)-binding protein [Dyadobacter sp. CY261]MCF0071105.1 NmrA family NAD(P)-binding protein [Dyadobacter sp. CY261]
MTEQQPFTHQTIVVAGATGHLGTLIVKELLARHAHVKALVRKDTPLTKTDPLEKAGAMVIPVDYQNTVTLVEALQNSQCVVSALSGLREVIVETQSLLLTAALDAGVPRFVPSDYCIDYTKLAEGSNRNLDLRREFAKILDHTPIHATSVLNGMFTDLLKGQAPLILPSFNRVIYWGDADQPMDFTTIADTAAFTAVAALDSQAPRFLKIAGEVATIRGLQRAASQAYGKEFSLRRMGGLGFLETMISIMRTIAPAKDSVFPPWQGMQYLHNMLTGLPKLEPLDNARYPEIKWTRVREVLA